MLASIHQNDILRLAQIVREETGNQVQEKNYSMLESRIRSHILKLGLETMQAYWDYFQKNEKAERMVLQSLMTTHYTFFFREYAHFELLDQWIQNYQSQLKSRYEKTKQPVRVWSAACSRGQEVYSLAMFLEVNLQKKYGIPFEVMGTDIDAESVTFAQNGVYAIREVNTIPHAYLNGFWKRGTGPIKEFAAVHPALKAKTQFQSLNLFEMSQWSNKNKFDVIFCRNVFIYFSEADVKKVSLDLASRLEPQGMLITGMSEPLRFAGWNLKTLGPSCYQNVIESVKPAAPAKSAPGAAPSSTPAATRSPNAPPGQAGPAAPPPVLELVKESVPSYKVLCVDDSPTIQLLIKKIFSQDTDCKGVDVANNGNEARQKLDAGKYDLITLDIHMPEVSGIEFLERLYSKKKDPPVLMVSSVNRSDIELATKSMSLGAFDYVEKPAMNNLQKSADEILTKAKMALRSKNQPAAETTTGFDASIAQKIVVPDASQCLRVVLASEESRSQLALVIKGQKNEYRSPALVVVWRGRSDGKSLEADLMEWTDRTIVTMRDEKQILKPNSIYLLNREMVEKVLPQIRVNTMSLQVLDPQVPPASALPKIQTLQILVDEPLMPQAKSIEGQWGVKVSDITPATSFPSLSVEFFAHLRKVAA